MYLLGLSENLKTSLRSRTTVSVASGDTFYFRSKVNTLKPNFVRVETLNETQTQNKNATSLWQTIGMYIGMMVGFLYPQIGLGLGMLLGIALGRLVLTKIPVNTPLAQRAQQKSAIILILAFLILFMNHWYVPCKHAIAHLMN